MDVTRREFLHTSLLVGTGLLVGCTINPRKLDPDASRSPSSSPADFQKLHSYLYVSTTGQVLLLVGRTEIGQGIFTGAATLVAEELGMRPADIQLHFVPKNDPDFKNPAFGENATGGSTSLPTLWLPLRSAAAGLREVLLQAAANRLTREKGSVVSAADCELRDGVVSHGWFSSGIPIGELVVEAKKLPFPTKPRLKEKKDFRVIGQSVPRLDMRAKVTGTAEYGIDFTMDGLVHCQVVRSPVLGGKARRIDASAALASKGVIKVVPISLGVAVVADSWWHAVKAAKLLRIDWGSGPTSKWSTANHRESLRAASRQPAKVVALTAPLLSEGGNVTAEYSVPYVPHSQLEPLACTVSIQGGRCDIWTGTQAPAAAIEIAAAKTGIPQDKIFLHGRFVGGAFGRRLHQDWIVETLEVALAVGRPVKNIWSRDREFQHDFYRPGSHHLMKGSADANGITSWFHRVVSPSIFGYSSQDIVAALISPAVSTGFANFVGRFAQDLFRGLIADPMAIEGAKVTPYYPPNLRVEYRHHEPALPIGFWRSVGAGSNLFPVESFVDELASSAGADPLRFRIQALTRAATGLRSFKTWLHELAVGMEQGVREAFHLPVEVIGNPALQHADPRRSLAVMQLLEKVSGWNGPQNGEISRGVACSFCFGSYMGLVLDVVVRDGRVQVKKAVAAVDCGLVVNPENVRAQVEGGIIFGLSAALKQEITFTNGVVDQTGFHACDVLRMAEAPEIEVHFVDSLEEASGVGELAVPAVAPALCNAIFRATGKRVRSLPVRLS